MAKRELHAQAITMRKEGMSYSQIRSILGVSKSSLSLWLQDYPLSEMQFHALELNNSATIEKIRSTKASKRNERLRKTFERVTKDIGTFSERETLLCGLYLYWGEGSKTHTTTVSVSNTDPAVVLSFKKWLLLMGAQEKRIKAYLHLYSDMNEGTEVQYWSSALNLPEMQFRKSYIKKSKRVELTYKQRFCHGTCNLIYHDARLGEYISSALEHLRAIAIADDGQV